MVYVDSIGKTLEDYPRPSVAVDTAVLTVPPGGELSIVLVHGDQRKPRLPGTFLHPGERLRDAVLRSLREKAGITGLSPRQLQVLDEPRRDPRGWVLSIAHVDAVPASCLAANDLMVIHPTANCPGLEFDHDKIVALAVDHLQAQYRERPDPSGLLPEPFTMRTLHALHEAVAGTRLMRDTFRRTMLPYLESSGEREVGTVGKPAALFVRSRGRSSAV